MGRLKFDKGRARRCVRSFLCVLFALIMVAAVILAAVYFTNFGM